jgi:hypothetical protein
MTKSASVTGLRLFGDLNTAHSVNRAAQQAFAEAALAGRLAACPACPGGPYHAARAQRSGTWCYMYTKHVRFWNTGVPEFSIFVEGNKKLPFYAFSALPGLTCPGAGECLRYCYSFKAWRYPAAFYRQLGNTLLLRSEGGRAHIAAAWRKLPNGLTIRLYVDGDVADGPTLRFWFGLLGDRPDLRCYGYSKSWAVFLGYAASGDAWPTNYRLNLSSGSIYGQAIRQRMADLPITRGEFVALPVAHKMPDRRGAPSAWREWAASLKVTARAAGIAKSFVCPGKCGDCLPNGEHACGSDRFKGITVVIGIH